MSEIEEIRLTEPRPEPAIRVSRFKTLSRRDPEFLAYLEGSFSQTHRALPMKSLNIGAATEEITFEVLPADQINKPDLIKILAFIVRPASLMLSLGPMLASLFYCFAHGLDVRWFLAVGSFVGVCAFHVALNLFNDYGDHMRGQDRVRPHGGSRVIQKGWVRALSVRRAAWGLSGFAILCGLPALFYSPVGIVALIAALLGLSFVFHKLRLRARGWSEIFAFALTGPLLTAGYAWAISETVSKTIVVLGCVYGAISLMYFHAANFENIMPDSQAGARTWATRTGFDASKKFFALTAALTFGSALAYVALFEQNLRLVPVLVVQVVFLVPLLMRVQSLASPLSSGLVGLRGQAILLCAWTTVVLVACFVWMSRLGN